MEQLLGNCGVGLVFIISAPAGTGKTTLVQMLTHEFPSVIASISYTTRSIRPGEINGVHYNFISEEEFRTRIDQGDFLEHVELYGHFYGTSKLWIEDTLKKGKHVILVIDTQGAMQLRKTRSERSIFIFITPPSLEELRKRLTKRKTESAKKITERLEWAKKELLCQTHYDYLIVNDELQIAYQTLRSILIAEEHRIR